MAALNLRAPQGLSLKQSINDRAPHSNARVVRVARQAPRLMAVKIAAKQVTPKVDVTVRPAANFADLRAAAGVRVSCFNLYPEDRSEYSKQNHRKLKLDQESNVLERKMTGAEPGYDKTKVLCYLALTPQPEDAELTTELMEEVDPSCKIPQDGDTPVQLCLGSLDLNICDRFPSESLQPAVFNAGEEGRAFIANVCVAPGARRQKIADKMMDVVKEYCYTNNIRDLYVHVVPSNKAAVALYKKAGFVMEREETADFAYCRDRERRMLLLFQCITEENKEEEKKESLGPERSAYI